MRFNPVCRKVSLIKFPRNILISEINKTFFEVILAKSFDANALRILKRKKNLRIIDISNFKGKKKFFKKDGDKKSKFKNKKKSFGFTNNPKYFGKKTTTINRWLNFIPAPRRPRPPAGPRRRRQ